jgi:hypothetical protein
MQLLSLLCDSPALTAGFTASTLTAPPVPRCELILASGYQCGFGLRSVVLL